MYWGQGCPHCARTKLLLESLKKDYNLSITYKEVYYNESNRAELFHIASQFGVPKSSIGVPFVIINNKAVVIGEMPKAYWEDLFNRFSQGVELNGVFTAKTYEKVINGGGGYAEQDSSDVLTWSVLIGAALVDSINPCTLAVMVMLLGVILISEGKRKALVAGLAFSFTIFVMYFLFGLGILKAISIADLTEIFYAIVTFAALILSLMEINAYFNYKPGFLSVEMPMFLRPYAKKIIENATSIPGVIIAAVFCSLFLVPCSSGPYLMVLGLLAKSKTLSNILYLLVYNTFFILPMIVITAFVVAGFASVEKINKARQTYIKQIHLISGIILFILFLIMIGNLLGYA